MTTETLDLIFLFLAFSFRITCVVFAVFSVYKMLELIR